MKYFINCNGLFFDFDYAERGRGCHNTLCFVKKCIHSPYDETLCLLDLNESNIVFDYKSNNTIHFNIVKR